MCLLRLCVICEAGEGQTLGVSRPTHIPQLRHGASKQDGTLPGSATFVVVKTGLGKSERGRIFV